MPDDISIVMLTDSRATDERAQSVVLTWPGSTTRQHALLDWHLTVIKFNKTMTTESNKKAGGGRQ